MSRLERGIQVLIIFSTLLGLPFLWEVYGLLPGFVFDFVAFGWVLFVLDSVLTFVRPIVSYYLGLLLAILALASSLPQSAHYTLVESGLYLQAATFLAGSAAEVLIVILVTYRYLTVRKKDEWEWPGAKSAA